MHKSYKVQIMVVYCLELLVTSPFLSKELAHMTVGCKHHFSFLLKLNIQTEQFIILIRIHHGYIYEQWLQNITPKTILLFYMWDFKISLNIFTFIGPILSQDSVLFDGPLFNHRFASDDY